MFNKKIVSFVFVCGILLFSVVNVFGADTSINSNGDNLMALVPAESLFCVRINDFDQMFTDLDQYLTGVAPMPFYEMVRMQLADMLGDPTLDSVDMKGNFVIFGVAEGLSGMSGTNDPNTPEVMIAGLIPIEDFQGYQSKNTACSPADENGICRMNSGTRGKFLIASVGRYVLLAKPSNYNQVAALVKEISAKTNVGLAGTLDPAELNRAVTEPIWAYSNIQQVKQAFGPMIDEGLAQMKASFVQMQAQGNTGMGNISAIMDIYWRIVDCLMTQTGYVSLTANPQPTVCTVTTCLSALPDSEMAGLFARNTAAAPDNRLLGYLEDPAMMNIVLRMDSPLIRQSYIKSMDLYSMIGGNGDPAGLEKLQKLTTEWIAASGDPAACTIQAGPAGEMFTMKYISAVKDNKQFRDLMNEYMKAMDTPLFTDLYKNFGMTFDVSTQPEIETYKGVSIDAATFGIQMTDPNTQQAKMVEAMYGGGIDYRWAVVDGYCVYAAGGAVENAIHQLIDDVKAGGVKPVNPAVQSALAMIPNAQQSDFAGTFNMLNTMNIFGKMMTGVKDANMPFPDMNFTSTSNIAFAGTAGDGKLEVQTVLPKEHLQEIATMMASFQPPQPQPQAQPQPDSAVPAEEDPKTF